MREHRKRRRWHGGLASRSVYRVGVRWEEERERGGKKRTNRMPVNLLLRL
jgi:hypothetical protein